MRLLVTGAAGFIGTSFVRQALGPRRADVARVVVVDALTYAGNYANLADLAGDAAFRFVHADIADAPAMAALVREEQIDTLVNFAAESHVDRSIEDAAPFLRTNVSGTLALLDAVRGLAGFRTFLHVSTDEVYGTIPTGRATEAAPLHPSSPYAASKAAADGFVQAYATTYGVPTVLTRCSNNYGPWQFPEKLIPLFVTNAFAGLQLPVYGDGMQVRDWIHVEDHCDAIWHVLSLGARDGDVFNVSAHNEVPNRDVTAAILRATGRGPDLIRHVTDRPGHDRRYAIDCSKAERELGWTPAWTFERGIRETIDWYKGNQSWVNQVRSGEYLKYYEKQYGKR